MVEWHVTPDYIINNWTDELFDLMVGKLAERKQRELDAIEGRPRVQPVSKSGAKIVSDEELFLQMGNKVKVIKKHGS